MAQVGRNDPCPCGSGKKYKKCCMKKDQAPRQINAKVISGSAGLFAKGILQSGAQHKQEEKDALQRKEKKEAEETKEEQDDKTS